MWTILWIFRMLNRYAVEIPTLPVDQCHSHLIRYLKGCWGLLSYRRAAKKGRHLGYTWYIGKRVCKSWCVIISTLFSRTTSMEFVNRRAAPFNHSGEKWKAETKSRSKMPVWTVSQRFGHPQWKRLFKELWSRPTTTADFGSPLWQIPYTSHVCLLEDQIQDWGVYLFTIPFGINAMDQRSGDGWFSRWFKSSSSIRVISMQNFVGTWWVDWFSAEQNYP